jgi:uncharacterized RDD family membrane protein YckC
VETASWARRILALVVDWFASTFVVILLLGGVEEWSGSRSAGFYVLAVFVLESAIFCALSGGSFGQVATRLRVVREDGDPRPIGPLQALVRQVLIALVIPPLVYRPDGRGLHDVAAGSAVVTIETYRGLTRKR